jgi:hypothetical protein
MSGRLSTLEQRIVWTRFERQTDKDVLLAMARWFCWRADGHTRSFTVGELAKKAGVPKRSTERALERLEADWWIEVTARRHRRPTLYRIVEHRLATMDPDGLIDAASPPEWRTNDRLVRHSGGQDPEWRTRNGRDSEKVADQRSEEEVRTDHPDRTAASEEVRHSGGQTGGQHVGRPEHRDVPAFLDWARVTYPHHAHGATFVIDRDRDGHLVSSLLDHYPLERLQAMAVQCWTCEADSDPNSHATWIAKSDRSLRVLKHKAAFLERVVVGAQQLTLPPMEPFTARELAEARRLLSFAYGRCPHTPAHEDWRDCVRAIALKRRAG